MTRSAAAKAVQAADALLAWLDTQTRSAAAPVQTTPVAGLPEKQWSGSIAMDDGGNPAPVRVADGADPAVQVPGKGAAPITGSANRSEHVSIYLPNTDWLHHRLSVTGPAEPLSAFRAAAAGSGTIPWTLDLDRMAEDWLHLLVSPPALPGSLTPQQRTLSVAGARIVASQLRDAVARRHELAVARVGRSQACPLDLHALVPVPDDVLRLGPDDPQALAWLWQHWGTTQALRRVTESCLTEDCLTEDRTATNKRRRPIGGEAASHLTFWSADWTPWRALADLEQRWPALRFAVRPTYQPA